jgi:hypothetical protein
MKHGRKRNGTPIDRSEITMKRFTEKYGLSLSNAQRNLQKDLEEVIPTAGKSQPEV